MSKKIFTVVFTFLALLFCSTFVFANDSLGDELKDSWNKTEGTMQNIGSAVSNTAQDIMGNTDNNDDRSSDDNGTMGMSTDNANNNNNGGIMGMSADNNGGYTATRTSTTNATAGNGLNSIAWTWIIMAITAVVIVSLIWYYANQENNQTKVNEQQNR